MEKIDFLFTSISLFWMFALWMIVSSLAILVTMEIWKVLLSASFNGKKVKHLYWWILSLILIPIFILILGFLFFSFVHKNFVLTEFQRSLGDVETGFFGTSSAYEKSFFLDHAASFSTETVEQCKKEMKDVSANQSYWHIATLYECRSNLIDVMDAQYEASEQLKIEQERKDQFEKSLERMRERIK